MIFGDGEMSHNTSGTCPWRILPVQRAQLSEWWPMAGVPGTTAASEEGSSDSSEAVRLL